MAGRALSLFRFIAGPEVRQLPPSNPCQVGEDDSSHGENGLHPALSSRARPVRYGRIARREKALYA